MIACPHSKPFFITSGYRCENNNKGDNEEIPGQRPSKKPLQGLRDSIRRPGSESARLSESQRNSYPSLKQPKEIPIR